MTEIHKRGVNWPTQIKDLTERQAKDLFSLGAVALYVGTDSVAYFWPQLAAKVFWPGAWFPKDGGPGGSVYDILRGEDVGTLKADGTVRLRVGPLEVSVGRIDNKYRVFDYRKGDKPVGRVSPSGEVYSGGLWGSQIGTVEDLNMQYRLLAGAALLLLVDSRPQFERTSTSLGASIFKSENFASRELNGSSLDSCNLESVSFQSSLLKNSSFRGSSLRNCNFVKADLSGANLTKVDLSNADLSQANVSSATLVGANLTNANLAGANLAGADLAGANLAGANLSDTNLYRTSMKFVRLRGSTIRNADMRAAEVILVDVPPEYLAPARTSEWTQISVCQS